MSSAKQFLTEIFPAFSTPPKSGKKTFDKL